MRCPFTRTHNMNAHAHKPLVNLIHASRHTAFDFSDRSVSYCYKEFLKVRLHKALVMLALDARLVSARLALRVLAGWFKVLLYSCALAKNFVVICNSCAKVRQA
jgi:hypothetical protein